MLALRFWRLDLNNKSFVNPGDPRANIAKLGGDFKKIVRGDIKIEIFWCCPVASNS
jgi:hypothetical protein